MDRIQHVTLSPRANETLEPHNVIVGKRGQRHHVDRQTLLDSMLDTDTYAARFCQWYLSYNTLMLDGRSRIDLIKEQNAGDLLQPPQTSFQTLFRDNTRRAEVRRIVNEAFSAHLVIDPTKLGKLRLRLSSKAPTSEVQERGIHEDAVQFHGDALSIQQASDGVNLHYS